jgi:hypothetical protein
MGGGGACTAHATIRPNQIARVMVGATLAVALVDSCGIWLPLRSPLWTRVVSGHPCGRPAVFTLQRRAKRSFW